MLKMLLQAKIKGITPDFGCEEGKKGSGIEFFFLGPELRGE